jgi:ankyrin repeat protein
MIACNRGAADIVAVLLAAGADVNATTTAGATALDLALARGHEDVALALRAVIGVVSS